MRRGASAPPNPPPPPLPPWPSMYKSCILTIYILRIAIRRTAGAVHVCLCLYPLTTNPKKRGGNLRAR